MKRSDLDKFDELNKLTDRELIKVAMQDWSHLPPLAQVLATRLEDKVIRFNRLLSLSTANKENPDGNDPGRKS